MKSITRSSLIGFSFLEISYWCFNASFVSFLTSYLLTKGISNSILSILLSAYLLAAFIGSFIWGFICDHLASNRTVIILCFILTGFLMYLIYALAPSVIALSILYPMLGFLSQPQAASIDAWLLRTCGNDMSVYGKIRCMPSIFFAIVSFFLGRLISAKGYYFMLLFGTFFLAAGTLAALCLPVPRPVADPESNMLPPKDAFSILIHCKPYIFLLVLVLLIGIASSPIYNLKASIFAVVDGTVSSIGIDSFIAAMTQVPFLALTGRIRKLPLRFRYIGMCCFHLLTLLLVFFASSPFMIFIGTFFYNTAYGIMLPTMREVTEVNTPSSCRNLGHNLSDAIYNSFSGIISLLYSGLVLDLFGMKTLLSICLLILCLAFLMTILFFRRYHGSLYRG